MGEGRKPLDYQSLTPVEAKALLTALDCVSDSLEVTDEAGALLFVNKSFEITMGYSAEEALGRTPRELMRSDAHDEEYFSDIWDRISSGKVWRGQLTSCSKDGSLRPHLATVVPVEHAGETLYVAVKQPLTVNQAERRGGRNDTSDEELHAVHQRLRVAYEDLIASASMAMVGQLVATVGHEINNPAQALRSCLEHLADRRDELGAEETDDIIKDALMALSRIESVTAELVPFSGRADNDSGRVDLNQAVARGLRMAHNELRHRAQITERLGQVPEVEGLEGRLAQLIGGLLMFVARAIPEDDDSELVIATTSNQDYVYAHLDCKARVPRGFFEEAKNRLQSWAGAHSVASQQWITIILCHQIAVSHGGTLQITNISDHGARISLRLPRTDGESAPRRKRILIIDDEDLVLRSMQRALRSDYEVETAVGGKLALEMIRDQHFDAIVCDVMMPGLSGVAVFERLAADDPEASRRMIFMSAGTFTDKTQHFANTTGQPVLRKPLGSEELKAALEALVAPESSSGR